ncbi:MAG: hypothetical protein BGO99_13830 [Nitrosospira sp. 56-18]|nr:hypothetical protein [Nitrosospira sp.]OJY12450.1 MAG: hypothetical protein BGO99_13830 [Nitrosospira sp. 56-18]
MKAQAIVDTATSDGLTLSIVGDNIKIDGDQEVIKRWIGIIKENKAAILAELKRPVTPHETLTKRDVTLHPRYTVTVTDATTDPVLVQVTIDGLATFDLAIPLAKYDGMAIIDAIERYSPVDAFSDEVALSAFYDENERIVELPDEQEREAA